MKSIIATLRIVIATLLICVGGYTAVILGVAQITPGTAGGSLITNSEGAVIGSRLVAQKFEKPGYFWPRPSAADYNGAGAGGSNKSPTSPDLTERGRELVASYGATLENPLPADLATASGAGLDPHITVHAARYQARRIANARGIEKARIDDLIEQSSFSVGGLLAPERIVNVLELNLSLDALR